MRKRQQPSSTKFLPHKLSVILNVDSALADQHLAGISLLSRAQSEATKFANNNGAELFVIKSENLLAQLKDIDSEIFVIHDVLRPLVTAEQMQRTYDALGNCQAARATMAFTETLKTVGIDGRLEATIDRDSVRRISSPEVIRKDAINFGGKMTTWSVPLINSFTSCEVESDAHGIRINSQPELKVLEALLQVADPGQK
jgi:2-C-methyl-D-erythritol 4-phosphate cytidylyltransferase